MAKEKKKTNKLYGVILRTTIEKGKLISVKLPDIDSSFVVISSSDLEQSNRIRFIDNYSPLLVKDNVSYIGQPILALFGPNYESVNYYVNKIELKYTEAEVIEDKQNLAPLKVGWGEDKGYFTNKDLKQVTTHYFSKTAHTEDYLTLRISVHFENEIAYVSCPGQWISHIKDAIAETLSMPKKNIVVDSSKFYAPNDELLTNPSVFAVLATLAAKKSGSDIELRTTYTSYKPEIEINRTTAVSKEAKPVAEKIEVKIDQGAFPVLSYELSSQLIAGLTPDYPLESYSVEVTTRSSCNPPANFYGGLGYSTGLANREIHSTNIANYFKLSPAKFKKDNLLHRENSEKFVKTLPVERLTTLINNICNISSFERKNFANTLQQKNKVRLKSLLSYSKGIGFASGPGVNGFTNHFQYNNLYGIEIILSSKNIVVINSNSQEENPSTLIWKKIIEKELDIKEENIRFLSSSDPNLMNIGPLVLSRDVGSIPILIKKACTEIKAKMATEKYPISSVQNLTTDKNAPLLNSNAWSSIIIELEVHPVYLYPIVKGCWAHFDFNEIFNKTLLSSSIKKIIDSTLMSLGAKNDNNLDIQLELTEKGKEPPTSVSSAVEGLVTAAFTSALSQALGKEISSLPVTTEEILNIIQGQTNAS